MNFKILLVSLFIGLMANSADAKVYNCTLSLDYFDGGNKYPFEIEAPAPPLQQHYFKDVTIMDELIKFTFAPGSVELNSPDFLIISMGQKGGTVVGSAYRYPVDTINVWVNLPNSKPSAKLLQCHVSEK